MYLYAFIKIICLLQNINVRINFLVLFLELCKIQWYLYHTTYDVICNNEVSDEKRNLVVIIFCNKKFVNNNGKQKTKEEYQ